MRSKKSTGPIREIVRTSLSDIIAGFILLVVSIFLFFNMFNVLRNPFFNAALGILFLYLATLTDVSKYRGNKEKLLNSDLNGIIVGLSLLAISIIGGMGHWEIIRNCIFPLIPGVLLMTVAISRIYLKTYSHKITLNRIDPCGIVGGELLIFYSVLLYLDFTALAWNPIFPLFVSAVLHTALFIDVLAMVGSNQTGINDATIWLDEIENKISDVRKEFESIKLAYDEPHLSKSLERLEVCQKRLLQLKAITTSQITATPSTEGLTELISTTGLTKPTEIAAIKVVSTPDAGISTIESGELKAHRGHGSSDEIFYETLTKEFELSGMSDIIREAKEMRNLIVLQRKKEDSINHESETSS